jgi:glycosyltransferase involved in cell wall biosynthesis
MNVLFCNPGLSFQADAPLTTRLRALAIQKADLTVTVMGYPASFVEEYSHYGLQYISVETMLHSKTRKRRAVWQRLLGNYWTFIVEPTIVIWQALRYANGHALDLVFMAHLEPWLMLLIWCVFPKRRKPRLLAMIPNIFYEKKAMRGRPLGSKIRGLLYTWATRVLPRFIHILCENHHVPAVIKIDQWPTIHVIPEGHRNLIPTTNTLAARRRLEIPSERRMLLMFGVASCAKGADLLLQALEGVPPTFDVYIVGQTGGVYLSTWGSPDRLYAMGWKNHLTIVPRRVMDDEMESYFSACDAIILPYRRGYVTSSGNLRLAVEHGKAVLACDQYCLGEIVRNYQLGLVFTPDDVAALRTCLLKFTEQPVVWFETIRGQCAVMNRDLAWEKVAKQYIDLFNKIILADR